MIDDSAAHHLIHVRTSGWDMGVAHRMAAVTVRRPQVHFNVKNPPGQPCKMHCKKKFAQTFADDYRT